MKEKKKPCTKCKKKQEKEKIYALAEKLYVHDTDGTYSTDICFRMARDFVTHSIFLMVKYDSGGVKDCSDGYSVVTLDNDNEEKENG